MNAPMPVALFTHPDMALHVPAQSHPERPARLGAVLDALEDAALAADRHEAQPIADADLLRVHSQTHLDAIRAAVPQSGMAFLDADTTMSPGSLIAAQRAAGAVTQAV